MENRREGGLEYLLGFLNELRAASVFYSLAVVQPNAIMVEIAVPGERWEVEFFTDGRVEAERFYSKGEIDGREALDVLRAEFYD